MTAHVSLNLPNKLGKSNKMRVLSSFLSFFARSMISSIIQEHEC